LSERLKAISWGQKTSTIPIFGAGEFAAGRHLKLAYCILT
jgi:hypothetical protein